MISVRVVDYYLSYLLPLLCFCCCVFVYLYLVGLCLCGVCSLLMCYAKKIALAMIDYKNVAAYSQS